MTPLFDAWVAWALFIFSSLLFVYAVRSIIFLTNARKFPIRKSKFTTNLDRNKLANDYVSSEDTVTRISSSETQQDFASKELPFVSILVATCNESIVIRQLLKSLSMQTYPIENFEIIIVDDSTDDTFDKILKFSAGLKNVKAIHRGTREGWKGGALNNAIELMSPHSFLAIVVDADAVLLSNTIEELVGEFSKRPPDAVALQGFPVSKAWLSTMARQGKSEQQDRLADNNEYGNWVSRAIDFRLAQRNLVEFSAKEKLSLPIQITGSLFMIRSDVLKKRRFRSDLCEDWDLTLDLYLQSSTGRNLPSSHDRRLVCNSQGIRGMVVFDPHLQCYCEATTKLQSYFRQRMRVSEGHTRAFRKRVMLILQNNRLSLKDKFEITLTGLQYAKFIAIPIIGILDILIMASAFDTHVIFSNNIVIASSIFTEAASFILAVLAIILGARVCTLVRKYGAKDIIGLLALTLLTMPAFIIGSLQGFLRDQGMFYRTQRNILQAIPDSTAA